MEQGTAGIQTEPCSKEEEGASVWLLPVLGFSYYKRARTEENRPKGPRSKGSENKTVPVKRARGQNGLS